MNISREAFEFQRKMILKKSLRRIATNFRRMKRCDYVQQLVLIMATGAIAGEMTIVMRRNYNESN